MTTTGTPSRPDPTRTGAVWVTGTGAFLLLAAAAVFTAMRWDQIPDAAKLGALGFATGAFLIAGRGLKATLPATAGALFHLGTFLVPIDVAAVGVRAELDWAQMLLAQGLAATVVFGWGARTERSVVLRWAFAAAVVALAGGIGGTTAVPAPLALAAFAATAVAVRHDALGTRWALLAGAAPLLTFLDALPHTGAGTLERLGLVGDQPRLVAVLTSVTAAAALAVVGRRRDDANLVLVGVATAAVGGAASWSGIDPSTSTTLVGLAATFVLVELAAFTTRGDRFWRDPADVVAQVAEWAAGAGSVLAAGAVLVAPASGGPEPVAALAALGLAGGWLVADRRRGGQGTRSTALAGSAALAGAVALATADAVMLAATLVAIAGAAVAIRHRGGPAVAVAAGLWAPVLVLDEPGVLVAVGVTASLLLARAAVRRSQAAPAGSPAAPVDEQWAWILSAVALLPGVIATAGYVDRTGHALAGLVGAAVLATLVAAVADRGRVTGSLPLGTLPRVGAVGVLAAGARLEAGELGLLALVVAGLSIGDALRRRDPHVALGASIAGPVAVGALAQAADLSVPASGVALTISAAVLVGLGALVGRRWSLPMMVAAGLSTGAGLVLAAGQPSAFADAVMIVSGIGLAIAVERGRLDGVALSGITMTAGVWLRLADAEVTATEPYLLPVAALLLGAGLRARSIGTSSWIAYGPVIGLLGGAAVVERVAGGAGWHALLAGTVAVVSVAAGGYRRLAAPLFLGTGLLVALVGYETLALTAALPTWTWLAVGGSALLAAGVAMERHDLGPLESGRRLVDVVDEHFA